jgi:hypothetical protein
MKNKKQKALIIVLCAAFRLSKSAIRNPHSEFLFAFLLDCVDNLFGAGGGRADFTDDDSGGVIC